MRRVAIVYDLGATPMDIVTSLDGIAEPIFVLPDSEHNLRIAPMLADVAEVTDAVGISDYRPSGITTFSDFQMDTTARLAAELGLRFHSPAAARTITRKFRQRERLNAHGVGNTPTALVTDRGSATAALGVVPLPAVLKPNRGVGGTDTYLVDSPERLSDLVASLLGDRACADDRGYVLEACLAAEPVAAPWGGYVSVESIVQGGQVRHLGVTGKFALSEPFRERGGYVPPLPGAGDTDELFGIAARALAALGAGDSVCHTEVMLTAAGPRIIEVNGRAGGNIQDLFLRGHGVNLIELAARVALGDAVDVRVTPPDGVVFSYFGLAPRGATRLTGIPGLAAVRDLVEVDVLDQRVLPGSPLDWRRGFRERIYTCRGAVASHADLAAFLPRMEGLLDMRFEIDQPATV